MKSAFACVLLACVIAGPSGVWATDSTLLIPYNQTRVVGPGDSWQPQPQTDGVREVWSTHSTDIHDVRRSLTGLESIAPTPKGVVEFATTVTPSALTQNRDVRWYGTLYTLADLSLRSVGIGFDRTAVQGKKERAQVRWARWIHSLQADRLAVYKANGLPASRHYQQRGDVEEELWDYPELHVQFVFQGSELVDKRRL